MPHLDEHGQPQPGPEPERTTWAKIAKVASMRVASLDTTTSLDETSMEVVSIDEIDPTKPEPIPVPASYNDALLLQRDRLEEALKCVLNSADPHPDHHPAMAKAWKHAYEVLASIDGARALIQRAIGGCSEYSK